MINLGERVNTLEDRIRIQQDFDKLENWVVENRTKFNKCRMLYKRKKKQIHMYRIRDN